MSADPNSADIPSGVVELAPHKQPTLDIAAASRRLTARSRPCTQRKQTQSKQQITPSRAVAENSNPVLYPYR